MLFHGCLQRDRLPRNTGRCISEGNIQAIFPLEFYKNDLVVSLAFLLNFLLIIMLRFVDLEQISHYEIFHRVSSFDQLDVMEIVSQKEKKRERYMRKIIHF